MGSPGLSQDMPSETHRTRDARRVVSIPAGAPLAGSAVACAATLLPNCGLRAPPHPTPHCLPSPVSRPHPWPGLPPSNGVPPRAPAKQGKKEEGGPWQRASGHRRVLFQISLLWKRPCVLLRRVVDVKYLSPQNWLSDKPQRKLRSVKLTWDCVQATPWFPSSQ